MANISVNPAFPNILIVTGADVHNADYLNKLKALLDNLPATVTSAVRKGTHDFWITYTKDSFGGGQHSHMDLNITPRPFRGLVRMGQIPGDVGTAIAGTLSVLLQEVGHHWLVPSDMKFNISGGMQSMLTDKQITQAINDEVEFSGPPLLARDNSHWSAYYVADGSPMDGLCYLQHPDEDEYQVWKNSDHCGITVSPIGLPDTKTSAYNDLDLMVMGVKTAAEAYGGAANGIKWFTPRLSAAHPYHAGLVVVFGANDQLIFGFDEDHQKLSVRSSNGAIQGSTVTITPNYHPLRQEFNGMSLRVVKKGNDYFFQAKIDNPLGGCLLAVLKALGLYKGMLKGVWDNADSPGPVDNTVDFQDWKTVAVVNKTGTPLAIGTTVNKKEHPFLCEAAFYRLFIKQGTSETSLSTDVIPPAMTPGNYAALPSGALRIQKPDGSIFKTKDGRLHLLAPFSGINPMGALEHFPADRFQHNAMIDNSLKMVTKSPNGDFAFASHVTLRRTIFTPWAGGYANGRKIWGKLGSTSPASAIIPADIVNRRQPPPPSNTYKIAFIFVAPDDASVTVAELERLDKIRRYWDEAFRLAMIDRRFSDSTL
jgi:hypothetical protein